MADLHRPADEHEARVLRRRGRTRRRGHGHTRPLPVTPLVTLYHARGCHLCERAQAVLRDLRAELGYQLEEIAIDDDPELEARYREWLPVVEIDGHRAFTYYVQPDALRRKLGAQSAGTDGTL